MTVTPEEIIARLLYRDGLMLVLDKPAGSAVHKGPKGGESLEDYFGALRFGLPRAPALAHRLDRDTSGCLVLGRHRKALASLGLLFKHGKVGKTYWAVVEGGPQADEGRIELPLGRRDASRGWWMKPDAKGQPAVTGHLAAPDVHCVTLAFARSSGIVIGEISVGEHRHHTTSEAATTEKSSNARSTAGALCPVDDSCATTTIALPASPAAPTWSVRATTRSR